MFCFDFTSTNLSALETIRSILFSIILPRLVRLCAFHIYSEAFHNWNCEFLIGFCRYFLAKCKTPTLPDKDYSLLNLYRPRYLELGNSKASTKERKSSSNKYSNHNSTPKGVFCEKNQVRSSSGSEVMAV